MDTLKIDRSLVMRMRDAGYPRNIVAMIVSLAWGKFAEMAPIFSVQAVRRQV